jgi:hypothetical protein
LLRPLPLRPWPFADDVARVLAEEFPWAQQVVARLRADLLLACRTSGRALTMRPLVLVGPAGCGKSRFVSRLLRLVEAGGGPGGVLYPLAGTTDNRLLAGTARGWSSESPCLPTMLALSTRCANPIVGLDELDKAGGNERNGDVRQSLLTMVEPTTATRYLDEGLGLPVDLNRVTWIGTANDWEKLPALLRTRFRHIDFPSPRPQDFPVLLHGILGDLAEDLGCAAEALPDLPPEVRAAAERGYRRGHLSARGLAHVVRRAVEEACVVEALQPRH